MINHIWKKIKSCTAGANEFILEKANLSLDQLRSYIEDEEFKGYDPYDTLLSPFPFKWFGKLGAVTAIQLQRRNPVNIRPLLGVKKEYNPKAMGLFLHGYSLLFRNNPCPDYLIQMNFFFNWLKNNYSKGYGGLCWGYNFPWASPAKYLSAFIPSAVVTGFIGRAVFEYYQATKNSEAVELLESASKFLINDLPITKDETGICFSYTPVKKDCCYNASLIAAEVLAKVYSLNKDEMLKKTAVDAVNYVVCRQKEDGRWNYNFHPETKNEKKQIDFHQGYVLESLYEIVKYTELENSDYTYSIKRGLEFYRSSQFNSNGRSYWRFPKKWPVDIHNQSQGMITFAKMKEFDNEYMDFANIIADWTITHMQDPKGYFYYQLFKSYKNKISYMRWSNAWMLLALTELLKKD